MKSRPEQRSSRLRQRFPLPAWLAPAVLLATLVPAALAQEQPATTAPADAGAPTTAPVTEKVTLLQMFHNGGIFMYPLAASSVLAIAIILERFIALRRSRVNPSRFLPGLRGVYRDPLRDREAAMAYCRADDSSIARLVMAGVRKMPMGTAAVERAIEDAGANEAIKLRRNLRMLYAIGSVATLLGLIGTISGMIQAFQVASGGGMGKTELLSKGIYEAMVCTFAGLAVAIVTTTFYYFFVGRVERLVSDMNDELDTFAEQYLDPVPLSLDDGNATGASGASARIPTPYAPPMPAAAAYPVGGVTPAPGGAGA
jgi:biopolymer transport protein ExbB